MNKKDTSSFYELLNDKKYRDCLAELWSLNPIREELQSCKQTQIDLKMS